MKTRLSHSLTSKSREICAFRGSQSSEAATCCPTAFQKIEQVQALPECGADQCEKPRKATSPTREESLEAQQQIAKQSRPDLPANSISTMAKEIGKFERLLDLFEEDLNGPTGAVEISYAAGTPLHVVREEFHLTFNTLYLHQSAHPPQAGRVFLFIGSIGREHDLLVGKNFRVGNLATFNHPETVAALRATYPEDTPHEQIVEVGEIHVGFVENNDLSIFQPCTDLTGSLGVIVAGRVNKGEAGQETLEVEPHVAFSGRLAAAVLGPVQTRSHQFDGRRIHNVDRLAEAADHPLASAAISKFRGKRLKMTQNRPESLLGQNRLPLFARVGKPVATRRGSPTKSREGAAMKLQGITHIVETNGVGQLGVEHCHDMTPSGKRPADLIHSGISRQRRHEVGWNEIAELAQNGELRRRWAGIFLFFHNLPHGRNGGSRPSFPTRFRQLYGMAVKSLQRDLSSGSPWKRLAKWGHNTTNIFVETSFVD